MKKKPQLSALWSDSIRVIMIPILMCVMALQTLHAQTILDKRVTISVKNQSLQEVVAMIKKQTAVNISFSAGVIKASGAITVSVKDKKLIDFLSTDLAGYNIDYRVVNNQVVLFQKGMMPDALKQSAALQNKGGIEVTGYVTDDKGAPVSGVTVSEKGVTNSTSTAENGAFKLKVGSVNSVLEFTNVGFGTQQVAVGNQLALNVSLKPEAGKLDEVVVVGYGTQKKITSTGSIASIGTKELVQSPVANISNSLVGRLPGLFATQAGGEPGNDGSIIRIRGIGTFTGTTNPLFLVDGIEVSNYNNIDPNEIESLTILKDASSTAVYGIRGANGVIIIVTKRGKAGPPRVNYTYNQSFNSFTNLRTSMTSAEWATAYNAGQKADAYANNSIYSPLYSATDIELYQSGADPIFHPNKNWFNELFRKVSTQTQHNLNVSGGQNKVRYFISGGFFDQQGLFKDLTSLIPDFNAQSTFRRYNIRSNFNFDVSKDFKIALDLSSQTEIRNGPNGGSGTERVIGDIARASPLDGPGIVDGKIVNINAKNNNPYINYLYQGQTGGVRRSYRNYLNGSLRLDESLGYITKGLAVHGLVGIQTYNTQEILNGKALISYMAYKLPDGTVNYVPSATETQFNFTQSGTFSRRITAEAGIDYKRSFGNHNVTGLVLYNQQKTYDPTFQFLVPKGYQSFAGRVTYDFKGRYLAAFDAGYNGSENFAPGKRFGFFPAYSLGWVVSQEKFFPQKSIVTFLKFRGSTGEVGFDQIGGNRFIYNPTSYTTIGNVYYFGNVGTNFAAYNGIREGGTGNKDVTWERSLKQNIGLDMRLWRDKISITADVFSEKRNNILALPQTISSVVGLSQPATNLGRMQNKGYEGEITYTDRIGKFGYRISGNYSFARNKVLFRDEIPPIYPYQARTGQRLGQFFAQINEGIFMTWDEVNDAKRPFYSDRNNRIQPGDLKIRDVNGDGVINSFDEVPIGYSNVPEKTFGLSLSADYKGFDLSVLFQGVGNVSLYYTRFQKNGGFGGAPPEGAAGYLNASYTPERAAAGLPISFPRFSLNSSFGTDFYLADASYIRLKNTEIGYRASLAMLKKIGIKSLRIYANANNLITWSHVYQGIDPENVSTGDTNSEPYPLVRTINVGLNVNF